MFFYCIALTLTCLGLLCLIKALRLYIKARPLMAEAKAYLEDGSWNESMELSGRAIALLTVARYWAAGTVGFCAGSLVLLMLT